MSAFPSFHEPLTGTVAELRLAAERDIPEILIAHQDDARLHVALGDRRPPSGAELGRRVERSAAERTAGTGLWLTIVASGAIPPDQCSGQLDIRAVDWGHGRAEIAVWVAPGQRRLGLGSEALRLTARWLLRDGGLVRVALLCEPGNAAAIAAARAASFRPEGVLRAYRRRGRERVDLAVMSLIDSDLEGA